MTAKQPFKLQKEHSSHGKISTSLHARRSSPEAKPHVSSRSWVISCPYRVILLSPRAVAHPGESCCPTNCTWPHVVPHGEPAAGLWGQGSGCSWP